MNHENHGVEGLDNLRRPARCPQFSFFWDDTGSIDLAMCNPPGGPELVEVSLVGLRQMQAAPISFGTVYVLDHIPEAKELLKNCGVAHELRNETSTM